MKNIRLAPALAGLFVLFVARSHATTITEDFSTNPQQNGWAVFGNTTLFQWDSTNHNLDVTWDSSQPNSFFHHSLGTILTRDDDFSVAFDLLLKDIASGTESGKTGPLQIGVGFLNWVDATNTGFERGADAAQNVVEFDYYPAGYYPPPYGPVDPTVASTLISSNNQFAYSFLNIEITTNDLFRVVMTYTSSNQTVTTVMTRNGAPFGPVPDVVLSNFTFSDFRADTVSVSSYSSAGDDFDSVLAHGVVDNVLLTVPPPPIQNLTGTYSNGVWQAVFISRSNWVYSLERTADIQSWTNVTSAISGSATNLFLMDTNPPARKAFYRVRANRP
jgi:hypothetical protein